MLILIEGLYINIWQWTLLLELKISPEFKKHSNSLRDSHLYKFRKSLDRKVSPNFDSKDYRIINKNSTTIAQFVSKGNQAVPKSMKGSKKVKESVGIYSNKCQYWHIKNQSASIKNNLWIKLMNTEKIFLKIRKISGD